MVINCNVPSFANLSTDQKLKKMEKYLYDLNDQLRVILNNLELDNFTVETRNQVTLSKETKDALKTDFETLKQAIIKTATEINSSIESVTTEMNARIEAISDFGTYAGEFVRETVDNALATTDVFTRLETVEGLVRTSTTYIKTGDFSSDIGDGEIHTGILIGAVSQDGGSALKVAIEAGKMSFFEDNHEVAYISGTELVINRAKVAEYIYFGGYRIEVINGIAFKWEG